MLKIIATLKLLTLITDKLSRILYRASIRIDDVRQRVVGATLNATAETLAVLGGVKARLYTETHANKVVDIGEQLKADMRLAHARHSDALKRLGESTDKAFAKVEAKAAKLRAKRDALRKLL